MRYDNKHKERELRGTLTVAKEHENVNQLLKRFKKKVEEAGIMDSLRKKELDRKSVV